MIEGVMLKQATKVGSVFLKVGGWRTFHSQHQKPEEEECRGKAIYHQRSWPAVKKFANWRRTK